MKNTIEIKNFCRPLLTKQECTTLWYTLRDILTQDKDERNAGRGGLFSSQNAGDLLSILTKLAVEIDELNKKEK